ncbi:MAG: SNF2-related protein [Kofleriaceae bacterium]
MAGSDAHPPIPPAAMRLVTASFDPVVVRRGLELVEEGRVHLTKPPPWPIVARVSGAEGHVVTVGYLPSGLHLRGECTCAVELDCKHAAAAALVALTRELDAQGDHALATRQATVGDWLVDLGRADVAPTPTDERGGNRVVAYVLDDRDGTFGLTVMQCPRLRDGRLGAGTPIAGLGDPQRGAPRWVGVDDLRRIALLRAVTRVPAMTQRLPLDRLHGELLADLAAGGTLCWRATDAPPLRYGAARAHPLGWIEDPREADSVRLGVDAAVVVVPAREIHYLDEHTGELGPLALGVPAALAQRLLAGPPVPQSMRATVESSLGPLLTEEAGPLAEAAARAATAIAPLRPRLLAGVDRDAEPAPILRLEGQADYDGVRLPLATWDPAHPIARDLVIEGRYHARLQRLVDALPHGARASTSLELLADARHVAEHVVPTLRGDGWECELADDFPHEAPLEDVGWVEQLSPREDGPGWFDLELGVTVGGRTIPLLPILLQAIRSGRLVLSAGEATPVAVGLNLRLPEGELIHVPADRVARWLRPLVELELAGEVDPRGAVPVPALLAAGLAADAPAAFATPATLLEASRRLTALLELEPRVEGRGFGGTLRPYQRTGLAWLRLLHDAGYGGLLADEMGLGKTVQVLAFLDGLRAARRLSAAAPALVVAPRSVVGNWAAEGLRFAPKLRPTIHLGADRADDADTLATSPLVVTSYQTLLRDARMFAEVRWTTVLFDEAQALKNPDTLLRTAAAGLRATSRFCITGTPIENHLGELWSQMDLVMPGLLGRRRAFDAVFRRPIERHGADEVLARLRSPRCGYRSSCDACKAVVLDYLPPDRILQCATSTRLAAAQSHEPSPRRASPRRARRRRHRRRPARDPRRPAQATPVLLRSAPDRSCRWRATC